MKRSQRTSGRATRPASAAPAPAPDPIPLRALPGVNWTRVRTARARIAAEYYDRGEVRERLVEALLSELKGR